MAEKRSDRVEKLRKSILNSEPTVCLERGRLVLEAYKENEADPLIVRRAKALDKVLRNMTIFINDGDLLVGNQSSMLRCPPIYPENFTGWMEDEKQMEAISIRTQNPLKIPKEKRSELIGIASYFKNRTLYDRCYAVFPESVKTARRSLCFSISGEKNAIGHCVLDYALLLRKGYKGIKENVLERLDSLDLTVPSELKKRDFYVAAGIICDAVVAFASRYANLASELAQNEVDVVRKNELARIADICKKVPLNPAESFYEAVQSVFLAHLVTMIETNGYSISFGRFDQYMYPYYKTSVDRGDITKEQAQEILNCFWCKTNEIHHVDDMESCKFHWGHPYGQHLTVGGLQADGTDATNELSYMCLTAHKLVELYQPDFSVRVHKKSPYQFLKHTAEVIKKGLGLPQLFNDDVLIPALVSKGLPLDEARNYTPTGCVENSTEKCWSRGNGGWFNLPKVLELTLNEGRCMLTNKQISFVSKHVDNISSFNELMDIFKQHLAYVTKLHVVWSNLIDNVHAELMPETSVSLFIHDCIDNGKDVVQGGARYNFISPLMVGLATTADSLAVIKKLVYENNQITLGELKKALDANFDGYEILRQQILNLPEKYGNDLDYVDDIAKHVTTVFCDEFEKYQNPRGGKYQVGFWSITANFSLGDGTAATPDGRKARMPLSDSISPNNGKDLSGLTASLNSASKLDQWRAANGTVLNRHISPGELDGEDKIVKFLQMVRSYFDMGGSNLGFNVISSEKLREAQNKPADYADLLVKVAGYAAFFVELGKEAQDALIERTENRLS